MFTASSFRSRKKYNELGYLACSKIPWTPRLWYKENINYELTIQIYILRFIIIIKRLQWHTASMPISIVSIYFNIKYQSTIKGQKKSINLSNHFLFLIKNYQPKCVNFPFSILYESTISKQCTIFPQLSWIIQCIGSRIGSAFPRKKQQLAIGLKVSRF